MITQDIAKERRLDSIFWVRAFISKKEFFVLLFKYDHNNILLEKRELNYCDPDDIVFRTKRQA